MAIMPRQIEAGLQEAVVRYLRLALHDCVVYHTPNGGRRSHKTAKLMKRIGTLSGVFDITILAPVGRAFFMEVKHGSGRLSPEQEVFRMALIRMGHPYCVVRSLDDAILALETWGLTRRRSARAVETDLLPREPGRQDNQNSKGRISRMGPGSGSLISDTPTPIKTDTRIKAAGQDRRHTSPIRPTRT